MKIIASTGNDAFIVEATADELAKCQGYPYNSTAPSEKRARIGQEVNVTDAYTMASDLVNSSREMTNAKESLEKVLRGLNAAMKVVIPRSDSVKTKMP